jgi:hypothetical protein
MRILLFLTFLLTLTGCARRTTVTSMPTWNFAAPPAAPPPAAHRARLWIDSIGGLGLFSDESYAVERQVAAWAVARGWNVVDPAAARQALERAKVGQDPQSGAACGLPLSRFLALRRWGPWFGAQGRIDADVDCDDKSHACDLIVDVNDDLEQEGERLAKFVAPFDARAPWPEALSRAFGALAPAAGGEPEGGLGVVGGILGGNEVRAKPERLTFSARPARSQDTNYDAFAQALSFPDGQAPLRACFATEDSAEMLVEVDARGKVIRCESRDAADALSSCTCDAFTRHADGAPAVRSHRAFVVVHFSPPSVVTSWGAVVEAHVDMHLEKYRGRRGEDQWRTVVSDRSIADWEPPRDDRVESCFADATQRGRIEVGVRVTFDATGRATAVDAQGRKPPTLSSTRRACLESAFLHSRAPCPATPISTADASVVATVRPVTR